VKEATPPSHNWRKLVWHHRGLHEDRFNPSAALISVVIIVAVTAVGTVSTWLSRSLDRRSAGPEAQPRRGSTAACRPGVGEEVNRTQSPLTSPPAAKTVAALPRALEMRNGRWRTPQPPSCEAGWGGWPHHRRHRHCHEHRQHCDQIAWPSMASKGSEAGLPRMIELPPKDSPPSVDCLRNR
jgi:hypothetical protein